MLEKLMKSHCNSRKPSLPKAPSALSNSEAKYFLGIYLTHPVIITLLFDFFRIDRGPTLTIATLGLLQKSFCPSLEAISSAPSEESDFTFTESLLLASTVISFTLIKTRIL